MKKEHKFFERFLDNDLDNLFDYLIKKQKDLLDGNIGDIPAEELAKYNRENGPTTRLGSFYNVFDFDHPSILKLKSALVDVMKEASEYYEIDFPAMEYKIHGWYNVVAKPDGDMIVDPLSSDSFMHDHMGGEGAPVFHGYYCVNSEPSTTYYKINNETKFGNVNKNNRLIVSETGHPHGRDSWNEDKSRMSIAYDIIPSSMLPEGAQNWIVLE
jgi:hypothetical protein